MTAIASPDLVPTFAGLPLRPELLAALDALGYEEPTPIQREAIPPLVAGRDLLGQAATGTGKTAAFALPLLERLPEGARGIDPAALVLVPTRELAVQVSQAMQRYGRELGVRVVAVYGGQPIHPQLRALERGVDVVVATPGRALDHLRRGALRAHALGVVVLDEADEMLDMGFAEDIEAILAHAPVERQTVLFSATMPPRIDRLAGSHLRNPVRIAIARESSAPGAAPRVRQRAHLVRRAHKPAALRRVLDIEAPAAAIVFCRTRDEVDALTEALNGVGHRAEALHGGMSQEQRDRVMGRVRAGAAHLLVATDVAARGLDLQQLTHVINYDVPSAPEAYVHRVGRVGRAGRDGVAVTLAEPREQRLLAAIERVAGQAIPIERLPSVADLRARRLERTRAALRARLAGDPAALEPFRAVVEALAGEEDAVAVAAAAVALAHDAAGPAADEEEIPRVAPRPARRPGGDARGGRGSRDRHGARGADDGRRGAAGADRAARLPAGPTTRVFVGLGREAGIRPGDLVGAITGETALGGRAIGAIEIAERFSLVEVPQGAADDVIAALRATKIKGRKATVRRERFTARR